MMRKVPRNALMFDLAMLGAAAATSEEVDGKRTRTVSGVANSGAPIEGHWFWGNLAIDLKGLKIGRQDKPILRDHRSDQVLGYTKKIAKTEHGLEFEGAIFDATEAGREVVELMDRGMPWQMSVYVPPSKVREVAADEEVEVNGHKMRGPGAVFTASRLREVTITAVGADENTRAAAFAGGDEEVEVEVEINDMKDKTTGAAPAEPAATSAPPPVALTDADVKTAAEQARLAERKRIAEINKISRGVDARLVAQAIDEGLAPEQAAVRFLAYVQEARAGELAAMRNGLGTTGVGNDDPDRRSVDESDERFTSGSGKQSTPAVNADPLSPEALKAEWSKATPHFRDEFMDSFERFAAWKRNDHRRGVTSRQEV